MPPAPINTFSRAGIAYEEYVEVAADDGLVGEFFAFAAEEEEGDGLFDDVVAVDAGGDAGWSGLRRSSPSPDRHLFSSDYSRLCLVLSSLERSLAKGRLVVFRAAWLIDRAFTNSCPLAKHTLFLQYFQLRAEFSET